MTVSLLNRDFIARFQRGSYESVSELYHLYYADLTEFAGQLILNKAEAHHIVQETFIKLFMMRGQFDNSPNIKAFLYITVRNICFTFIKSEHPDVPSEQVNWYANEQQLANRFNNEAVRNEAVQQAYNVLEQLPDRLRAILLLIFSKRLTIPAVAEQMAMDSVTAAKERIEAIRLLREQLYTKHLFSVPFFIYFLVSALRDE
jgi:RNA polymerase sigma-70 factor (ECF subfamily)